MCVLYWSFLWRPQWRRLDSMCEMFQIGAHILCWYGGRDCLWPLSRINTVLFLVCILCICILCVFCNYSFTFFVNYSPPQIRRTHLPILGTRMRLIWGDEAFTEMNFTHLFLFIMYDVHVATVSLLIKLSYSCALESFNHFPKFNSSFKKPPHIRRLSPTNIHSE
jgi:hypothetical protein